MGVTYKLKEEVLQFIIQRKADNPKISCQDISDDILSQFEIKVSKSSVHEALKHAGIIKPRERKTKDAFEIPQVAKVKIQEDIVKAAAQLLPANPIPPPETPVVLIADIVNQKPSIAEASFIEVKDEIPTITRSAPIMQAGEIILNALLDQMGLTSAQDFDKVNNDAYHTFLIDAYRLDFLDAAPLYLDSQFGDIDETIDGLTTHPRFLPGAIVLACDCFVNGIKPVKVKTDIKPHLLARLEQLLDNPTSLVKVALVNKNGQQITAFECLKRQRQVIKTVDLTPTAFAATQEKRAATLVSLAYQVFGQGISDGRFAYLINTEGFTIKTLTENTLNLIIAPQEQDSKAVEDLCACLTALGLNFNGLDNVVVKAIDPSAV